MATTFILRFPFTVENPVVVNFTWNGSIVLRGCVIPGFNDGAFCLGCVLFGEEMGHNGIKLSNLFKDPLVNWQTATQRFRYHEKTSLLHRDSMLRLAQFDDVMSGRTKGIDEQTDQQRSDQIRRNRGILATIVDTVILSGRQNFALRGHHNDCKDGNLSSSKLSNERR